MKKIIVDREFLENYVDTSEMTHFNIQDIASFLEGEILTEENINYAIEKCGF